MIGRVMKMKSTRDRQTETRAMCKQGRKRCSEKIASVLDYRRLNGEL